MINSKVELDTYLRNINPDDRYIVQEFYEAKYEIGVLYEKIPFLNDGHIISVVLKKNEGNWKPLKCGNITNNDYVNCVDLTEQLKNSNFANIIRTISSRIPDFHAGRYDIGFETVEDLENGDFKFFELNGVMGYDLRASFLENDSITEIVKKIYYILRWIAVRFLIGFINIVTLRMSPLGLFNSYRSSIRYYTLCSDWEHLFQSSPA